MKNKFTEKSIRPLSNLLLGLMVLSGLQSCKKEPIQGKSSMLINAGEYSFIATGVPLTKTLELDSCYELDVFQGLDMITSVNVIFTQDQNQRIMGNVYSDDEVLLFSYSFYDDDQPCIVYSVDDEDLIAFASTSFSSSGYRRRGERYVSCVSRVTDQLYESGMDHSGPITQETLGWFAAAAAHLVGVVGCTRYTDQSL